MMLPDDKKRDILYSKAKEFEKEYFTDETSGPLTEEEKP